MEPVKEKNKNYIEIDEKIVDAFIEVSYRKTVADITVSEICKKANVNHTTFYRHYKGIWEVKDRISNSIKKRITDSLIKFSREDFISDPEKVIHELTTTIGKRVELYGRISRTLFFRDNAISILAEIKHTISENWGLDEESGKENAIFSIFFPGVSIAYIEWINEHLKCTLEELEESIVSLIKGLILYRQMNDNK